MGKYLHGYIDFEMPVREPNLKSEKVGEDYENLPKRGKVRHEGSWRYKRAFLDHTVLDNMCKKHVNEPYEVLFSEIALKFKTGSLERLHIDRDIVWMLKNDAENSRYLMEGYTIHEGIIRLVRKMKGRCVIIIP